MAATKTAGNATIDDATAAFAAEGCSSPHTWGNGAGDRLDLEPGTAHAATVGPGGCRCVEASR